MSSELTVAGIPTGENVFAIVRRDTDEKAWSVADEVFADFEQSNFAEFAIPLNEQSTSGYYVGNFPVGITTAGIYNITYYSQNGSDFDYEAASSLPWTGSETDDGLPTVGINWITRAEYKTFKGITTTDYDDQIDSMLPMAAAVCNSYIGRTIKATSHVKVYRNQLHSCLNLGQYPINSVTSLTFDYYSASPTEVDGNSVYANEVGTLRFKGSSNGQSFRCPDIKAIFSAGYTTVPADLKLACCMVIQSMLYVADDENVLVEKSVKDTKIKYGDPVFMIASDPVLGSARTILDQYKNESLVV